MQFGDLNAAGPSGKIREEVGSELGRWLRGNWPGGNWLRELVPNGSVSKGCGPPKTWSSLLLGSFFGTNLHSVSVKTKKHFTRPPVS